ncbi:MAG TPA: FAD-dependent oxidoreductase [Gemmatimonadales bacterium]|nr:FAD-dependent oxidoreductase [Gemmatimonadales bacterium]
MSEPSLTTMRRDIPALADATFDLLIVGAGIYGACAAWDAALRGLTVAVVDQGDFGAATSANSLRLVHGGLRYLARGEFSRMRESIGERSTLLRIAPGLVEPIPVLVPTYGAGTRGRIAHAAALALNDLLSLKRNRHLGPDRVIPDGRLVSREECLRLFPWFDSNGLSGGAIWHDALLRRPERLTLSFVQAAVATGAVAANYLRVTELLTRDGAVRGVRAIDSVTGTELEIRARAVLVAAGPWTERLVATATRQRPGESQGRALALNVVIGRKLADVGFGVRSRSGRREDPVCGGHRFLFCAPQGKGSALGTWYAANAIDPQATRKHGISALLREFNDSCPGLDLASSDVVGCQWGWLPLKEGREPGRSDALAEHPRIADHCEQGIRHLLSVEGVKYTTARLVAEQAIDRVFSSLGRTSPPCCTAELRLPGAEDRAGAEPGAIPAREEIVGAVRNEMAINLADIVFRRTALGAIPGPDRAAVEAVARTAGAELGWDPLRQEAEIDTVLRQAGVDGATLEAVG